MVDIGVVVWANSLDYITTRLAIDDAARVHRRRGYKIKLLCLSGYELFKQTQCEKYGYEVIDCAPYFSELEKKYANVRAMFSHDNRGNFFFNNTMRWFVLDKFLTGKKRLSVDGDIVINRGSIDILDRSGIDFFYPDSTCFVLISDDFLRSYTEIVDYLNTNTEAAVEHIKSFSRQHNIHHWELSSVEKASDLDEEKIASFAVHYGDLYNIPDDRRPKLACPPFVAHAWGDPPLGRYLTPEFLAYPEGVRYSFINDQHQFSGHPLAFMHYQEQLHYIIGCHRMLSRLGAVDDVYVNLLTKDRVYDFLRGETETKYPAFIRLLHDISHHPWTMNENYWDMRNIIGEAEEKGMGDIFTAERWHSPNMFTPSQARHQVTRSMFHPSDT
ncbi:hypothetical protein AB4Z34_29260 [Ensifer sp. 2YAB10]|uniref:hypothetical protein n=1 Tax=unclassified Ensifer TaxID=2633371 RepID=UPI003F8DE58D